jgi:hypothetical protein
VSSPGHDAAASCASRSMRRCGESSSRIVSAGERWFAAMGLPPVWNRTGVATIVLHWRFRAAVPTRHSTRMPSRASACAMRVAESSGRLRCGEGLRGDEEARTRHLSRVRLRCASVPSGATRSSVLRVL